MTVTFSGPYSIGRKQAPAREIKMVTLGDTGCKVQDQQDCNWSYARKSNWWPLATIVQNAAKAKPDLVIHVGDFRYYRENQSPDTWRLWAKDFFQPAQALLLKAPWAFSRGNHCCKHGFELIADHLGAGCDGGPISFTSRCCVDYAKTACPGDLCRSYQWADLNDGRVEIAIF